jgi:hypothetical protein
MEENILMSGPTDQVKFKGAHLLPHLELAGQQGIAIREEKDIERARSELVQGFKLYTENVSGGLSRLGSEICMNRVHIP